MGPEAWDEVTREAAPGMDRKLAELLIRVGATVRSDQILKGQRQNCFPCPNQGDTDPSA